MPALTRVCVRCHSEKPVEAFPIKDKARGTRYYLGKNVRARVRHRDTNRAVVYEYLSTHPCVGCGETDPVVLDFDHVDPETKLFSVGAMLSRQSTSAIRREMEKCVVRCGNCHRMRTAIQFGSYRIGEDQHAYAC